MDGEDVIDRDGPRGRGSTEGKGTRNGVEVMKGADSQGKGTAGFARIGEEVGDGKDEGGLARSSIEDGGDPFLLGLIEDGPLLGQSGGLIDCVVIAGEGGKREKLSSAIGKTHRRMNR